MRDWLSNKKNLTITIVALAVLVLLTSGFFVYRAVINIQKIQDSYSKTGADSLIEKGLTAQKDGNKDEALKYFRQAKEQYDTIGDENGSINADFLIFAIKEQ